MRMEHKSPLPDIELNLSPRPFESLDRFEGHAKAPIEIISPPKQQPPPQQPQYQYQHQNHTEHDRLVAPFENTQNTTFETATIHENQNIQPIETIPKTSYSSVSNRVKTLEHCKNEQRIVSAYAPLTVWNTSNEPIAPAAPPFKLGVQIEKPISSPIDQINGTGTPYSVHETIEKITDKVQEYQQSYRSTDYDLRAPALVKHVTSAVKPIVNGYQSQEREFIPEQIQLQPGEPPEICYAPRSINERRVSIVETIEKSLEKDLERGPSKVLPHSVRTMPPSPQKSAPIDVFESTKHNIAKGYTQHEFSEQNKHFNHIKNIFYEHNKPIQRNTFDQVATPTHAPPDKVRNACFRVHIYF